MPVSKDPLARLAEQLPWITSHAEVAAQKAVAESLESLGGQPLRKAIHGTWLHEPLHAAVVSVPLGAWTATAAFDAIAAVTKSDKLDTAADATLVLGLLGAAGAALTGINDWADIERAAPRRIGAVHGLLNVSATALYVASLIARRRRARPTGRVLAALGYAVVSASAHLGGNLTYEHGIGVARSAENDELLGL